MKYGKMTYKENDKLDNCTKYTKGTKEYLDNEEFNLHQLTNEIIETCHE
jgi:hypothetical protein